MDELYDGGPVRAENTFGVLEYGSVDDWYILPMYDDGMSVDDTAQRDPPDDIDDLE